MLPRSNPCICTKENIQEFLTDRAETWVKEIERLFIRHQDDPEAMDGLLVLIDELKTIIWNLDIFTEDLLHFHEYLLHESAGTMAP